MYNSSWRGRNCPQTVEHAETLKAEFESIPEIQQCYYVAGVVDFILVVVVPTMGAYEALTRRLFIGNDKVKRFESFVTMERIKVGLALPMSV